MNQFGGTFEIVCEEYYYNITIKVPLSNLTLKPDYDPQNPQKEPDPVNPGPRKV